jgi:YfiH family protein
MIRPEWPAPARVRAFVTTRAEGDMGSAAARRTLRALLPSEPMWLRQVHGKEAISDFEKSREADASFTRSPGTVCVVMAADCMPVMFTDEAGSAVAVAHAGWRGLCAGVLEETIGSLSLPPANLLAWLGPAIGPKVYEVGDEVRAAFIARDASAAPAFVAANGKWLLDLYAVARQRLTQAGIKSIHGGGFCTYTEEDRFFSYRRSRTAERMAALIWLT